ncbi:electron transporter, putative [Actinidia rufa]|uniref:Electron transporter, putative n=1 Tax=Actinidia rufa TaxID=165716 RepID=A0A7J0HBJ7_9ERIC|nr:electron transporter, putative [Actinidia rufa]
MYNYQAPQKTASTSFAPTTPRLVEAVVHLRVMASLVDVAVHEPTKIMRKKRLSGQQKKGELEREVSMLRKMLEHEQKVHEILEHVNDRHDHSAFSIPNFLPPKGLTNFRELLSFEGNHKGIQLQTIPKHDSKQPSRIFTTFAKFDLQQRGSERMPFETKALHFISKAIKGDYNLNDFSVNNEKVRNLRAFSDHNKENSFRDEGGIGFQEKVSRKSGMLKPSSPLREPRHPTPKRESNVEVPLDLPQKSVPNPIQSEEENTQKWSPNKLSESTMKCLIFIFVRLLRTSRAMELEKSGPVSRSANFSLSSRSFRVDTSSSNSKTSLLQKESRQQDPYGIFNTEESIPRDIGPYKNLVIFTARNLDPKCISNSSSVPLVQRLRVLMNSLQKVDLRFLTYQQKLAFWINIYNACIMHGFLQYGVPSSPEKLLTLMNKATFNVGGNTINAHAIEHFILRKPPSSILKEVYRVGEKENKEAVVRDLYGLESSDPNVTFSLCCGTRSSPAVRIYRADGVVSELEKSKLEYLQASIAVTSTKKIALPELLLRNMHDFAQDTDSLVEWVCHQLPTSGSLRKSMVDCFRSLNASAKMSSIVEKIPYDFEFQYLLPI